VRRLRGPVGCTWTEGARRNDVPDHRRGAARRHAHRALSAAAGAAGAAVPRQGRGRLRALPADRGLRRGLPDAGADVHRRLRRRLVSVLGRSLHVRYVDAGDCGGCAAEIEAARSPVHDLTRFGIDFVASPRHADLLLVAGPVTSAMAQPLEATWAAMAEPRL